MTDFVKVSHKKRRNNNKAKKGRDKTYVPPHLRNKAIETQSIDVKSETEFPTILSNNDIDECVIYDDNKSTKFTDLFDNNDENDIKLKENDELPYGWVKIHKNGTITHTISQEERDRIEHEEEVERQRKIMREMYEKHEYYKQQRRENTFGGYMSDSTNGTNDDSYLYEDYAEDEFYDSNAENSDYEGDY